VTLQNLDTNGIGRYDNPHNTVGLSFSQLLNQGLESVSAGISAGSKPGLVPIIPTRVFADGTGTGFSIDEVGVVSFSLANVIQIDGCFTSARTILVKATYTTTGNAVVTARLRRNLNQEISSTYTSGSSSASSSWQLQGAPGAGGRSLLSMELASPGRQTFTQADSSLTWRSTATGALVSSRVGLWSTEPNAYNGLQIFCSPGFMSGEIEFWAYNR
jgi:hypothetical protein